MVARDDDSARTRLLALFHKIDFIQPLALVRRPQLLRKIVVTDTSRVHHRLGREDILRKWHSQINRVPGREDTHSSPTRSVLARSSSDVRDGIVFYDLLVATTNIVSDHGSTKNDGGDTHRLMLILRKDRIVGFEVVLFQYCFSISDLHVKERVTHAENLVRHGGRLEESG